MLSESAATAVAVGDASATRTVYAVVGALGVIGVALVVLAIWLIKQTKPDRELLAPLERMNDRSWRKQEPAQMRRDLDEVRPPGARPVVRGQQVPDVDDEFAQSRPVLASFDDLQAQLAADARRGRSGSSDPLLAPRPPAPANADADDVDDANDADDAKKSDDAGPGVAGSVTVGSTGSPELAALLDDWPRPDLGAGAEAGTEAGDDAGNGDAPAS
jgi:hypothetical protein